MTIVTLNVGGTIFEVTDDCLRAFENTRLGKLSNSRLHYNSERGQYFFNRNPVLFNYILDLYRTGSLHLPKHLCGATLRQELEYWEIPLELLSECCYKTYIQHEKDEQMIEEIRNSIMNKVDYSDIDCKTNRWVNFKRHGWRFLDQPSSSLPARIFAVFFQLVVFSSILVYSLATLPYYRTTLTTDEELENMKNTSTIPYIFKELDFSNPKLKQLFTTAMNSTLWYMEIFFLVFFSLELFFHFLFCPRKRRFFLSVFNILDFVICISMWIVVILVYLEDGIVIRSVTIIYKISGILYGVIVIRLLRIFRLLKLYSGIQILYFTLKSSLKDIVLLLVCYITVCVMFGALIYFVEFGESTTFRNMFVSIWWAVITMTTVGYGDHYPKSPAGCIVGACCSLCGVIFLAIPITILSTHFKEYFEHNKDRQRFSNRRDEMKSTPQHSFEIYASESQHLESYLW